ncbi:Transcriptional activator DEMETER [Auxenochlorella protothecoides]|uniref:Transcriptional activator DEMETER n=1 Tax=Auxenochlorella protothecoides TaxID=3075 RepID=A0A087SKK5_AUXPR|nr:Transcriptional activator DEMETER [Auxenochlorella protothecoides]KFM26259.1 Transcriptional activator DEMETER [Auxenochlorella protothecoides]
MVAYGADEILLWHKRVATFQQAMRAVLGDRRRTFLWSGSVLDSVIGAFLTQNVADHLSSSAFMIMAARFPPAADLARHDHSDSVDWEAVRCADKAQVADAIKGRGMQNFLAARIHDCLNHIRRVNWARSKGQDWASVGHISVKKEAQGPGPEPLSVAADQEGANAGTDPGKALPAGLPLDLEADADELEAEGIPRPEPIMTLTSTPVPDPWDETCPGMEAQELLSLEWVRDLPPKEAHDFLSSLHGLGRKSVACIVLLTLRNKEFPVDVNVGRIAARLGWIPLDSEDAVEALDDYAPEPEVHKYLHSRLVGFDVETLYELHYQMITLGKVFCNKLRPNCSACPLRDACEFALNGGPEKKVRRAAAQAAGLALAPPTPDKHREASARPQPAIRRASLAMPGELEASPPRPRPAHKLHWRQVQRLQRMQAEQDPERGAGLDAVLGSVKRGKRSRRGGAGGEPDGIVDLTPLGGLAEDLSMDAESLEPMILHSVPQEDSEPLARRQRYRQLSRHVHPDRCSHPDAHEVFSALQLALEVLQEEMVPAPDIAVGEQVGCGKEDAGPRFQSVAELGRSNDEALGGVRNPARLVLHCLAVPWGMLPPRLARYGSSQRREQLPLFLPEPSSTALLGRFPLNGTYFQVNEVFADHSTVTNPVEIELCDLEGRDSVPVFIGHSIHHMAKGMAYEEVRSMFGRGHVCFRAWDSGTGNPEALPTWLLAGSGLKTKTKWKNSVERAADRAARLAALIEKHGPLAAAALGVQLTSPRARVPAPPRPKAPPQVRPERPGQRRRSFFPTIRSIQKCGVCAACLNPGWKKACLTRRAEMEALAQSILEADGAEEIQAGPGAEVDEGDADLAAEEEGEDLGLASEDKGEALEPLAEEEGKARDPVAMHPEDMIPA